MTTYINDQFTLQELPRKFTKMVEGVGWSLLARYRAQKTGTRQFAEVRIFESVGTDGLRRNLGMVWGYDFDKPTFDDSRFVADTSRLAIAGVGDGTKVTFETPGGPMVVGTEKVFLDGVEVVKANYTFNAQADQVTFTTAPALGKIVKVTGYLSSQAHEPINVFGTFTYNEVYFDRAAAKGTPDGNLGAANASKTAFNTPKKPIRPGTVRVYVGGVEASDTSYTVDFENGVITFTTAPATGLIEADYRYFVTPVRGVDYGDIQVTSTESDAFLGKGFMSLAYSAFTYIQPSLPTIMTLTDETNLSRTFNRDSYVYIWGSVNKDRLALFFRADPSADPVKSFYLPFYFGRLHVAGEAPRRNTVLIGGAKTGAPIPWTKDLKIANTLMDYGDKTSNGNDSVLLHQSIGGSLYQKHYLAFITHDRALDSQDSKFNPSAYTGKYHISQIWVVHPQEGYVGKLDDLYAIHPKNIEQMDELELDKIVPHEWVGNGDGVRKVFHIEHQCKELKPLVFVDCVEQTTGWTYDAAHKAIVFTTPPAAGVEITASYTFKQLFKYTLPTTPRTPMRLDDMTPFNPIGWGIFKENTE